MTKNKTSVIKIQINEINMKILDGCSRKRLKNEPRKKRRESSIGLTNEDDECTKYMIPRETEEGVFD